MADNVTISKTELLYDPLFDKKPDLKMKTIIKLDCLI